MYKLKRKEDVNKPQCPFTKILTKKSTDICLQESNIKNLR